MNTIAIQKINITDLSIDAIVNAANDDIWAESGSAVITPAFNLKSKYIIHAVVPRWTDGKHNEPKLLYSAYRRSLELAVENSCKTIGFPLVSADVFGYPIDQAWRKALQACRDFLDKSNEIDIVFAVLSDNNIEIGRKILKEVAPQYAIAVKGDWQISDMPAQHDSFILNRSFTPEQMKTLRKGNIPQEMEDKWFWYMEGDTLFAHRSWTGFCIYRIDFSPDSHHRVIVNRDPEQYASTVDEDRKRINMLLDWWSSSPYDYYHEWLSETIDTLKKTDMIKDKLKVAGQEVEAVFFHKPSEPHGYLSNWYLSPFDLNGIHYTSVEQYIMYQKCMIFGDTASAKAILATDDTGLQQAIGRNAKGYIGNVWAGRRQLVAARGLLAKFSQNEDLKKKLLDTGDAWLVECAHSDTIWACGIRLNEDERFDANKWRGQNILGFTLMDVRAILRKAEEQLVDPFDSEQQYDNTFRKKDWPVEVQSYILNLSFPRELDDVLNIKKSYPCLFDMEVLLYTDEIYSWTAPKWVKPGDIVFFMHSKTSILTIRRLKKELEQKSNLYNAEDSAILNNALQKGEEIYSKYGAKIFMVGRADETPVYIPHDELDHSPYWKSHIYVNVCDCQLLENPVDLSDFSSFIKLSCGGSITPVFGMEFESLKELIKKKENVIPEYFETSRAMPIPLAQINENNWLQVSSQYRMSFIYESQFRAFYVDYLLRQLGDRKTIYRECSCKKGESHPSYVDNVIMFGGKYLPVEVKLSKDAETDLRGQLRKYCYVDILYLDKKENRIADNSKVVSDKVLLVDTFGVYLYTFKDDSITEMASLEDINDVSDIRQVRERILSTIQ